MPVHDDRLLFEYLTLEGAQAGLSWATILRKRPYYRQAFAGFDPAAVARFTAKREAKLLADPGIVRNRLKVASTISNAKAVLAVQDEFGSLDAYLWQLRRRRAAPQPLAVDARGAGPDAGVRRDEQGAPAPRLPIRRLDDLLRVHAGRRHGQRPHDHVLPTPVTTPSQLHSCAREPRRPSRPDRLAAADAADFGPGVVERAGRAGARARPAPRPAGLRSGHRAGRLRRSPSRTSSRQRRPGDAVHDFSENPDGDMGAAGAAVATAAASTASSPSAAAARSTAPRASTSSWPTAATIADFRGYGKRPRPDAADDRHPDHGRHRQRRAVVRRASPTPAPTSRWPAAIPARPSASRCSTRS